MKYRIGSWVVLTNKEIDRIKTSFPVNVFPSEWAVKISHIDIDAEQYSFDVESNNYTWPISDSDIDHEATSELHKSSTEFHGLKLKEISPSDLTRQNIESKRVYSRFRDNPISLVDHRTTVALGVLNQVKLYILEEEENDF